MRKNEVKEARAYIYHDIQTVKASDGYVSWVLEAEINGKTVTKQGTEEIKAFTKYQADLEAVELVLLRMKSPVFVKIYCLQNHFECALRQGWIDTWEKNGWINSKGKEVANVEQWQRVYDLYLENKVSFHTGKHQYLEFEKHEIFKAKRAKEADKSSMRSGF